MRNRVAILLAMLLAALVVTVPGPVYASPQVADVGEITETPFRLPVGPEPGGADGTATPADPVTLDASVFTGQGGQRRPAVLLAHGFGGSKADLRDQAQSLVRAGYVVATYTARGFGASGGRIHLNDPRYEIADARAMLSYLARRADVQLDAPGDPRVGIAGASYGGALALMTAALDPRVDAIVPAVTWNDLSAALAPSGVLKERWLSVFFSGALAAAASAQPTTPAPRTTPATPAAPASPPTCGRFAPQVCTPFLQTAADPTVANISALAAILRAHSPAAVLPKTTARPMPPTLLVQGMADSLFGIEQAQANLAGLTATGAPVALRWFDGGHDGGSTPPDDDLHTWLQRYLTDEGRTQTGLPFDGFTTPVPALRRNAPARMLRHGTPPAGLIPAQPTRTGGAAETPDETDVASVRLAPAPGAPAAQTLISPPGGDPAAMITLTGLPGATEQGTDLLGATAQAAYRLAALPGQSAAFDTAPLEGSRTVVGSPRVRLSVASTAGDATLFVSWWRVAQTGNTLPRRLVTPIKVRTTPGRSSTVDVVLPAATYAMEAGSTWRVLVSATASGYAVPTDARIYTVSLADARLLLPTPGWAQGGAESEADPETRGVGIALLVVFALILAAALATWWHGRRDDRRHTRADLADVPLVVDRLVKTYRDGHRAVDDVSWRAERGQVVGLLGPNGAGKTTTMRMIVGLIRPESGMVYVHGVPVHAGSPVLGRVGTLIEGPGFLPHLTGRANLTAYWNATGRRPEDARFEQALDVAALGDAVDRPVRSYSHGMKQRLGIAQAMLGMPEVLLLDEPTNGLDPPQIAAMRPILRRYAATGRTVVISSHLLAEVEATCTHVVVMHRGRVVVTGAVDALTDSAATTVIDLAPGGSPRRTARIAMRLRKIPNTQVEVDGMRLIVHSRAPRQDLVAAVSAGGGDIVGVAGHRRLEEVFLGVIAHGAEHRPVGHHPHDAHDLESGEQMEDLDALRRVRDR